MDELMTRATTANPDAERFGVILRRLREERGWTIRKLATRAGMNATYLGVVERGLNVPSLTAFLELLDVLNADAGKVTNELIAARNTPAKPRA